MGPFFGEFRPHAVVLLYNPEIVLRYRTYVFMGVLPGPVQMGPIDHLQMAISVQGEKESELKEVSNQHCVIRTYQAKLIFIPASFYRVTALYCTRPLSISF